VTREQLTGWAARLRDGGLPDGAVLIKRNPVRSVARVGDALLKSYARPNRRPRREARALRRAARRGVPVPQLIDVGPDWVATHWIENRPATRDDLALILAAVEHMHASGVLHGDLHLGNLLVSNGSLVVTDLQRTRCLAWLPGLLRRRELGYLAYSLGEPIPEELAGARRWCSWRAQRHWRSRTRRCVLESSRFTRFEADQARGFRRRDADPEQLRAVLADLGRAERIKDRPGANLYRSGAWIVKEHRSTRAARRAWVNACGLEARGIGTARALAWAGRWLVMEDAGETLDAWIDRCFAAAEDTAREALAGELGRLLAVLHRRGIYHADLKANNVAWQPGAAPRLLDYGRVHFGWRIGLRRRVKNLAQLNAALPDRVDERFRQAALTHYLRESGFRGDAPRLRDRVIRSSLKRRHRWTGC
jgi:tRNA A-37 threonylcarbamoyl transferase component Bud32